MWNPLCYPNESGGGLVVVGLGAPVLYWRLSMSQVSRRGKSTSCPGAARMQMGTLPILGQPLRFWLQKGQVEADWGFIQSFQGARVGSTTTCYRVNWLWFQCWCEERIPDPLVCTVGSVLFFLQCLLDRGLSHHKPTVLLYLQLITITYALSIWKDKLSQERRETDSMV